MTTTILVALLPLLPAHDVGSAKPFDPLRFLVGSFTGTGKSQMGAYAESFSGKADLSGSVITVRSSSKAAGMTVFEDLRVFSYDRTTKRIRCRQFAFGAVATYDVTVEDDGEKVVMTEVDYEGGRRAPWRYSFTDISKTGFSYAVHARRGEEWKPYVAGKLTRKRD